MNKIYKIIWSKTQHCFVVASEFCRSQTKTHAVSTPNTIQNSSSQKHFSSFKTLKLTPIVVGLLLAGASISAYALPTTNSQINTAANSTVLLPTQSTSLKFTSQNSVLVDTDANTISNGATVSGINTSNAVNIGSNTNITTNGIAASGNITISGNSNTITVSGVNSNAIINSGIASVSITGSSNTITATGSGTTAININLGSVTISGTNNNITATGTESNGIDTNAGSVNISGTSNTIIASGDNAFTITGNSVNISGNSNTLTAAGNESLVIGVDDSIDITGNNNIITASGPTSLDFQVGNTGGFVSITGNNNTITALGANSYNINASTSVIISGTNNTLTATGSDGSYVIGVLGSNSVTISGENNKLTTVGPNSTTIDSGIVAIVGTNDMITTSGNNASAINDTSISITGTGNMITAQGVSDSAIDSSGSVSITGTNNTVTASGNDSFAIQVNNTDPVSITGNNNTISASGSNSYAINSNGAVIISGANNTVTATESNSYTISNDDPTAVTVATLPEGNTTAIKSSGDVTVSGNDNTITAQGVSDVAIKSSGTVTISGSNNTITAQETAIDSTGNVTISGTNNVINGNIESSGNVTITGTDGTRINGNVTSTGTLTLDDAVIEGTFSGSTVKLTGGFLTGSTARFNSDITLASGKNLGFIQSQSNQNETSPRTLTINGNLTGNGGGVLLNRGDNLVITGQVSGQTIPIDITNTSRIGGETTASGIEIISVGSVAATDSTPFRLNTANGILTVGAHNYRLVSAPEGASSVEAYTYNLEEDSGTTWSLVSDGYSALAHLVSVPNFVLQNATNENINAINGVMNQAINSNMQEQVAKHSVWFKLLQAYSQNDTQGTASASYKNNLYGFLLGGDVLHLKRDILGVYAGYQNGSVDATGTTYSDVDDTFIANSNSNVGNLTLNDYTLGIYNQYHVRQFIINSFLQESLGDINTDDIPSISNDSSFNINSFAAQATVGYAATLNKNLELIPFAGIQGTWDHLDNATFGNSTESVSTVSFRDDNNISVLAGVNGYLTLVRGKNAAPIVHLTFGTDIQQYLGNGNTNNIDIATNGFTTNLNSSISKTFMNVNVGINYRAAPNFYLGLGIALGYNLGSVHAIGFDSTETFHLQYQF